MLIPPAADVFMGKNILILILILASATEVMAQPHNPGNPVPLDGGLSALLAAGIGYGAKKAYDVRKKRNTPA